MLQVKTGLEQLLKEPPGWIEGKRLGLLANPASVDTSFNHARDLISNRFPGQLTALFSPQHGFFAEKQDNMIESGNITDQTLDIPVFSLYGDTRIPDRRMFEGIDILLIDLQDVGTRVYTFIYTMSYCLESAKKYNKTIVILDRPNPVNGITVEGNLLSTEFSSFVGRYPIPMRHGLTIGELALFFNSRFNIGCELKVIKMNNWKRDSYFRETGLPWILPSPNLPTPESAMVYPGQVLLEGTNVSEGRGTTTPFELFGAPFMEPEKIISTLGSNKLPGVTLRSTSFEPTFNKWAKQPCHGFYIHITDPTAYDSYGTTLKIIQSIIKNHPDEFQWKQPPYEYEYEKLPIDLIIGDRKIRKAIETFASVDKMKESWRGELLMFKYSCKEFHLYG